MSSVRFETRVQGIPCQVDMTYYPPEHGERERGSGLQLEPDYPGYWEIDGIYDRKGYRASWLAKKVTKEDERRIANELSESFK